MNEQKSLYREILLLAVGELIATGLMLGVFALLGKWSTQVLLGSLAGLLLACLNYLLMAVSVDLAAKKAEQGDVAGGKGVMTVSMLLRYGLMIGGLLLGVLVFKLHPLATAIPLLLAHGIIMLGEFIRKAGEKK
mgnify:CR=1 FL=1